MGATSGARLGIGSLVGRLLDRSAGSGGGRPARVGDAPQRQGESLLVLAQAAERDTDGTSHARRMELLSGRLAARAGLDPAAAAEVGWSSILHDVGKLQVPDQILLNPLPLGAEEWAVVRRHPAWGEEALGDDPGLAVARSIARSHHENWDGSGYPDALYGDRIPLAARIVRIADAFDAMTTGRPYQRSVSIEAALEEISASSGHDFDPALAREFGDLVRSDAALRTRLTVLRRVQAAVPSRA